MPRRVKPPKENGRTDTWVKWPALRTALRDITLLGLGVAVILSQAFGPPERVNLWLIGAGLAILGVPGGIGIANAIRGSSRTQDTPSEQPSSQSSSSSPH